MQKNVGLTRRFFALFCLFQFGSLLMVRRQRLVHSDPEYLYPFTTLQISTMTGKGFCARMRQFFQISLTIGIVPGMFYLQRCKFQMG